MITAPIGIHPPHPARMPAKLVLGTALLGVAALIALFVPLLGSDPNAIDPGLPTAPPFSAGHWLGTDDLGRDLLSRLAVGAQISLWIGLATAMVSVLVGTATGIVAALFEETLDTPLMRLIDILYSLPGLMLVILFSVFLGRSITSLVLALSIFSWPDTARIIRGQVLSLKREQFTEAFHSLGGHPLRLVLRHFLPNLLPLILLGMTITIPRAILTESTLSFIGLGVEPPLSSWGTLASDGWQLIRVAPHLLLLPSLAIAVTMMGLHWLADGLGERLDPHTGSAGKS